MHDLPALVAALVPLSFILVWLVDALTELTNRDWVSLKTKACAFVGAFGIISLYAHSQVELANTNAWFAALPWQGVAFVALAVAASGGLAHDYLRARNPNDPSVKSRLRLFDRKAA